MSARPRAKVLGFLRDRDASAHGAHSFLEQAHAAVQRHGRFDVALTGGETPRAMYQMLAEPPLLGSVPWQHVHVFWGDERAVAPQHPRSNFLMAKKAFLAKVPIPDANVHRMRGELPAQEAARLYARELHAHFGPGLPQFDLVHLGVGADGHVASLFPGAAQLDVQDQTVVDSVEPDRQEPRITLTLPVINAALRIEVLVLDPGKTDVVRAVLTHSESGRRLPAGRVSPRGELIWLISESIAQKVNAPARSPRRNVP